MNPSPGFKKSFLDLTVTVPLNGILTMHQVEKIWMDLLRILPFSGKDFYFVTYEKIKFFIQNHGPEIVCPEY